MVWIRSLKEETPNPKPLSPPKPSNRNQGFGACRPAHGSLQLLSGRACERQSGTAVAKIRLWDMMLTEGG